jgi:zinc transport system permease protein
MILVTLLGAVSLVLVVIFYKELLSITFDAQASRLMGIPVVLLSNIFNMLVAITIVLSIKVVGMILVTALLVLPGLTALQLNTGFKVTAIMSVLFGVGSVVVGIFTSAILDVATGGVIVFTLVLVFFVVSLLARVSPSEPFSP